MRTHDPESHIAPPTETPRSLTGDALTRSSRDRHAGYLQPALRTPGAVRERMYVGAAHGGMFSSGAGRLWYVALAVLALLAVLGSRMSHAVIDCWEGEPAYRPDLLVRADIATPHIAGHSYEGKVNGTAIVYRKACAFFGVEAACPFTLPPPPVPLWQADAAGRNDEDALRDLVLSVYDIEADSQRLKVSCEADTATRAAAFDAQRSDYPMRREFASTCVRLFNASESLLAKVRGLGFVAAMD